VDQSTVFAQKIGELVGYERENCSRDTLYCKSKLSRVVLQAGLDSLILHDSSFII
jgi:hypothetical protein